MTVSRVMSGASGVRPQTRERVQRSVEALGYHRNETARSIRPGHTSGMIGVSVSNIANPYYGELMLGIEEIANQDGRRILVGNTSENPVREAQLIDDFSGRRVEGLIVVPTAAAEQTLSPLRRTDLPIVFASRPSNEVAADTVLIDDVGGARRGTAMLIREGHQRIAFLGNLLSVSTGRRRYEGFLQAHRSAGLDVDPSLVSWGQQDSYSAQQAMATLIDRDDPPTAVFCANNRNTIGAVRALHVSGRYPRGSFRIVGFDNFDLADLLPYPISVVQHDARELGRRAAKLLLERITGAARDLPPRLQQLPTELIDLSWDL